MGNAGSSSLAGTAIKVAVAAGGAALAVGAWSYATSLLTQHDAPAEYSDDRKPTASTESAEEINSQQLEMFLSDYHDDPLSKQSGYFQIPPAPKRDPRPQGTIKIMSYNIWSITGFKMIERMKAIDNLVQKHSPDMILLQEVTPMIYKIFQKCYWWDSYGCSVPQEKSATKGFFCMMLSKLHVKKFYCKHLESTTTGRGLCVAGIKTGGNKKMVVATCHLKSPEPPKNMHSAERVSQANAAIGILDLTRNVVLGGDMNWDESSDGAFPLLPKWRDAWSTLRPGEDGWTYDTVSNGMLAHSRPLQRRLDRFVCKLKDFRMIGIEMIGTEAIPGVRYKKLPVNPSDHYGLLLTICPNQ